MHSLFSNLCWAENLYNNNNVKVYLDPHPVHQWDDDDGCGGVVEQGGCSGGGGGGYK